MPENKKSTHVNSDFVSKYPVHCDAWPFSFRYTLVFPRYYRIMATETPENTPVSLFKRLLAIFYDAFLLLALLFIVGVIAAGIFTFTINDGNAITPEHPTYLAYQLFMLTLLFSTAFLFLGWFWTHGGQTLGMRTWRIKLISNDGSNISWDQAFIRCFTALISWGLLDWVFYGPCLIRKTEPGMTWLPVVF